MKNLHCFVPQQNQEPGDLCNKIRLLPLQSAGTGRPYPLGINSSYVSVAANTRSYVIRGGGEGGQRPFESCQLLLHVNHYL